MSPASLDLRTLATVAIFVATYAAASVARRYGRIGLPLTLASLWFGTWWLS